jgi:hypothetical protein
MTDAQKFKIYFPAWNACCRANAWSMRGGMVQFDGSRLSEEGAKVMTFARQRAVMQHRPMTLNDIRHGVHWIALGRDKSSSHLTNAELDRVVSLLRLLSDPDDLSARMRWDAYARGEDPGAVTRLDYFIRTAAPDAYVRKMALDMCGTRTWEDLGMAQKQVLSRALSQRRKTFQRPMAPGAAARTGQPGRAYELKAEMKFETTTNPF